MKYRTNLLSTSIYCGVVTAASAMLLAGTPTDPLDPGFVSISGYFAQLGGQSNIDGFAASFVRADAEPSVLALLGVSLAGIPAIHSQRGLRMRDTAVALGLLIYLAPLLALAALAVRLNGRGPLFQTYDVITPEGFHVRLCHFRTVPSSNARRWQQRIQAFLRVSRIACLPGLFNVIRGDIKLRDVFANDMPGAVPVSG